MAIRRQSSTWSMSLKGQVYVGDGSSFADKTEEMDFIAFGLVEKYLRCGKPKKVEMIGNISVKHFHGEGKAAVRDPDFEPVG